jgi:hypothetical protein
MSSERKSAIWVGVLYVVATVAGVATVGPWGTLTDGPGILANAAAHETELMTVVLLNLVMAVAVAGVAFMIYPILKRDADTETKEGLALWYVGTRITEGAVFVVAILAMLAQLPLSREFVAAGAPEGSYFQTVGTLLEDAGDFGWMLGQSVFSVGAAMLYYLLFVSRRVPRWISGWGLVSTPLFLVASLSLLWTGDPNSTVSTVLYAPLALQEMVLALWLVVKGFRPTPAAAGVPGERGVAVSGATEGLV